MKAATENLSTTIEKGTIVSGVLHESCRPLHPGVERVESAHFLAWAGDEAAVLLGAQGTGRHLDGEVVYLVGETVEGA